MSVMRRQVLQGHSGAGKIMSRRAKLKLEQQSVTSSPALTPAGSKNPSVSGSRPTSKQGSQVGSAGDISPPGESSMHELTDGLEDLGLLDPEQSLKDVVAQMDDRDYWRGPSKNRAQALNLYANSLAQLCATSLVGDHAEEIIPVAIRCLKEGAESSCCEPACRVLALTMLIDEDNNLDNSIIQDLFRTLKHTCSDNSDEAGQSAAIYAVGHAVFFGPVLKPEVISTMNFLMKIIETDGEHVDAKDSIKVVNAAMRSWAYLSTLIAPNDELFTTALEAFTEQLKSSSMDIVLSAAQAIALLYERQYKLRVGEDDVDDFSKNIQEESYLHEEEFDVDENEGTNDEESELDAKPMYRKWVWTRKYFYTAPFHADIKAQLKELLSSRTTRKSVNKHQIKEVKLVLRDVAYAITRPYRGPRYSRAWTRESDKDTRDTQMLGHRLSVEDYVVDRWWKFWRLMEFRQLLKGGLVNGMHGCEKVRGALTEGAEVRSRFIGKDDDEEEE
jgi:hypothetical protein